MSLVLQAVSYSIGEASILRGVSAKMATGQVIGLVGPNGAGKSTLADIISGFRAATFGRVYLNGCELTGRPPGEIARIGVARMFQGPHLAWNLTVVENVLTGVFGGTRSTVAGAARRAGRQEARARAEIVLGRVGLASEAGKLARNLSFGQQRLLALARTLAFPSYLLLLDEPFTGLKGAAVDRILETLRAEAEAQRMVLVIDHLLPALEELGGPMWFLEGGRLKSFENYDELARSAHFRQAYLGRTGSIVQEVRSHSNTADLSFPRTQVSEGAAILTLSGVALGYGSTPLLNDINLEVAEGEVVCVIGLNGVGKSSLLRAVVGTAQVLAGSIRLDQEDLLSKSTDRRILQGIRVLPQDERVFRTLSVYDNLLLSAAAVTNGTHQSGIPLLWPNSVARDLAANAAAAVDAVARPASTLSGGEQARVAFAHLDFGRVRLLLLDEPTSGLDGMAKALLLERIRDWQGKGLATVVVEHDLPFVLSIASRIILVTHGLAEEVVGGPLLSVSELLDLLARSGR